MAQAPLQLRCLVDGITVEVTVCWPLDQLELVNAKWPGGVDIAVLAQPGYDGMGTAAQRRWLVDTARLLARRARRAMKAAGYEAPRADVIGVIGETPQLDEYFAANSGSTTETQHGDEAQEEDEEAQR